MKTIIRTLLLHMLIAFFSIITVAPALGQSVVPPMEVRTGFLKKYPGEEPIIYGWRKLKDTYIATFIYKGGYRYTRLDAKGWWQEEGIALDKDNLPKEIWDAMPEMDITAFVYESYRARNREDQEGFLVIYETDQERIDVFITTQGKVVRKDHYPIPGSEPEEESSPATTDEVDWGDGK